MPITVKCEKCGSDITVYEAVTSANEVIDLESSKAEITAKADAAIVLVKQQNQIIIDQISSLLQQLQ